MNDIQQQTVTAKNELHKQIGKFLGMFPHIWGMPTDSFHHALARELGCAPETIRGYTTKGISAEFNFTQLSEALKRVLNSFVNDPAVDPKVRETAKQNHKVCGDSLLLLLNKLFLAAEVLRIAKPLQSDENRMEVTLNLFVHGRWPEHSDGLSKEETEWLRQCLAKFPPKNMDPSLTLNERAVAQYLEDTAQ